jgi:hypothetical protein
VKKLPKLSIISSDKFDKLYPAVMNWEAELMMNSKKAFKVK